MTHWQPTASHKALRLRAQLLTTIRQFFSEHQVLEVETPLLCHHTVTDVHIDSFPVDPYFLQTSPEYAMKRLLAADSGPIYQICKAFRQEESGHQHNPEFTLLEWYRPGFDHHQLMDELDALLQMIFKSSSADRITYQDLLKENITIDPLTTSQSELQTLIADKKIMTSDNAQKLDKDTCLQLLISECIEPSLGKENPLFIYDYPASQSALAKISSDNPLVAERFELYFKGTELANGFHELTHPKEQRKRFEDNQKQREENNQWIPAIDEHLIAALEAGLPDCAGVAIGLDRILMILMQSNTIEDVISFPIKNA